MHLVSFIIRNLTQWTVTWTSDLMHDSLIRLISNWVRILAVLMHLGLKHGAFVPHNMLPVNGNPFHFLKFRWPLDLGA